MSYKPDTPAANGPGLPRHACLPINRCNLPASILGSLTFQRHPSPLALDGVAELHRDLFAVLDALTDGASRARRFIDYMTVHFRLEHLDEAGLDAAAPRHRGKANYQRLLRGWAFDADSREGAVLKGWVESRFGLLPRFHREPLRDFSGAGYRAYLEERAAGLYGTNALEAQIDLLYAYCQYELGRRLAGTTHLLLYRGTNRLTDYEVLSPPGGAAPILLLNNLSSFSATRERAGEFGDHIASVPVPLPKILFYPHLLPGMLAGEDEYIVMGGLYQAESVSALGAACAPAQPTGGKAHPTAAATTIVANATFLDGIEHARNPRPIRLPGSARPWRESCGGERISAGSTPCTPPYCRTSSTPSAKAAPRPISVQAPWPTYAIPTPGRRCPPPATS